MMTTQCMQGRVCDRVYDTGRDLLAAGVIEGGDMLPEVALVKMMWALGNERDPEKTADLMQDRSQGGMQPEEYPWTISQLVLPRASRSTSS